ncbi:hypothetical protein [Peribacillus phoenicis]|uniref:hypothetical protein n=1 Tax=unclassified Peribacillus TaxID=2675266 RepID=UPI00399F6F03
MIKAAQEGAAIAEETSAGAEEVTAVTSEQAIVMENVEKSAMELKVQAEKLNRNLSRFTLDILQQETGVGFLLLCDEKGWTSFIFS